MWKGVEISCDCQKSVGALVILPISPKDNLLHGTDIRALTTGGEIFYKLSYGLLDNIEIKDKLGWYYGSPDGKAFYMEDHKAWLALNKNQAISKTFSIWRIRIGVFLNI